MFFLLFSMAVVCEDRPTVQGNLDNSAYHSDRQGDVYEEAKNSYLSYEPDAFAMGCRPMGMTFEFETWQTDVSDVDQEEVALGEAPTLEAGDLDTPRPVPTDELGGGVVPVVGVETPEEEGRPEVDASDVVTQADER